MSIVRAAAERQWTARTLSVFRAQLNVLRRLLFFVRGLSELRGSVPRFLVVAYQCGRSESAPWKTWMRGKVVSDLLLLPGSLCINPTFVPFLRYTAVPC